MYQKTDRERLESLRLSIARVAQQAKVQSTKLPVVDADEEKLRELIKQDEGWNGLCGRLVGWIEEKNGELV